MPSNLDVKVVSVFLTDLSVHLWLFIKDKLLEVYILDWKDSFESFTIDFQITPPPQEDYTSFSHEGYSICLLIQALANTEN